MASAELTRLELLLNDLRNNKTMPAEQREKEMRQARKQIRKLREKEGLPSLREEQKASGGTGDKPRREKKDKPVFMSADERKAARKKERQEKKKDVRARKKEATEEEEYRRTRTFVAEIPEHVLEWLKSEHGMKNFTHSDILRQQPGYGFLMEDPGSDNAADYIRLAHMMVEKYKQRWGGMPKWFALSREGRKQILLLGPTGRFIDQDLPDFGDGDDDGEDEQQLEELYEGEVA